MSSSDVIGVVVIARHGDRQGFYQDPLTYSASQTAITPLGNVQEFQLGQLLRSMYLESNSSELVQGVSTGLFNPLQVLVRADSGDEGGVIFDSAVSVVQGLWPATTSYNTTLANGTTIVAPLGGYQYIPIESVEPDEDVSLEGYADCNTFNDATAAFYNSTLFKQVAAESQNFLQSLSPFLGGRPVTLQNMFNIFDFMNVQSIHNETFANSLPTGYLAQARTLASFHEYGVFTSPQVDGIGNIAGRAMLPSIINGMDRIVNASDPLTFVFEAISYKPFLSLFNMTGVAETYPQLANLVDYASSAVFELRNSTTPGDPLVRMVFRNGTSAGAAFNTYNMFGQPGDVPLSLFKSKLQFAAVNSTAEWCVVCSNNADRGCGTCNSPVLAAAAASAEAGHHHALSPAAAGVVGAAVTVAAFLIALGSLMALGLLSVGRKARKGRHGARTASDEKLQHDLDGRSSTKS
ncbi:phosphoglycerate mutase-like protein [Phellopilus nigrolimitatus]|nr:phosphoglycerate mutase-like protein [Phellopilus nigrolimitatus]